MKKFVRIAIVFVILIVLVILGFVTNSCIAQYVYSQNVVVCYNNGDDFPYTFENKKYKDYSEDEFYFKFPNLRLKNTLTELGSVGTKDDSGKISNFSFCSVYPFADDNNVNFLEVYSWNNPWKKEKTIGSYYSCDVLVREDFALPDLETASIKRIIINDPSSRAILFEITDQEQIKQFIQSYQNAETNIFDGLDFKSGFYEVLLDYAEYPFYECIATVKGGENPQATYISRLSR